MDYDNLEPCPVSETNMRRSLKDRECVECRGKIPKGEQHEHTAALWDGSWHHSRRCLDCRDLCAEMDRDLAPRGCVYFGELTDELYELEDHDPRRQRFADICRKRGSRWRHWGDFDTRNNDAALGLEVTP